MSNTCAPRGTVALAPKRRELPMPHVTDHLVSHDGKMHFPIKKVTRCTLETVAHSITTHYCFIIEFSTAKTLSVLTQLT